MASITHHHPQHQAAVEELVRVVDQHHDHCLRSLRSLHGSLGVRRRERADSRNTVPEEGFTPPLRAYTGPDPSNHPAPSLAPSRRATALSPSERERSSTTLLCPSPKPLVPLTPSNNDYAIPEEDLSFIPLLDLSTPTPSPSPGARLRSETFEAPRTKSTLTPIFFTDDMLLQHLRETEFSEVMRNLLDDLMSRRDEIDLAIPFRDFAAFEREGYVSATFEVYDVAADATARKTSRDVDVQGLVTYAGVTPFEGQDAIVDAPTVWETIKEVNPDGKSVGRITIVQEPTPLILASLHLAMSPHFDMSELLEHLLSDTLNKGRTRACMSRAFERPPVDPAYASSPAASSWNDERAEKVLPTQCHPHQSFAHLRQRSFFFVFKYYTVVGDGLEPAAWQRFDKRSSDTRQVDHVDIAECSSVLALSLGGEPTKTLRMRPRRERAREGFLFDTFGPWHLLSIQSFPDDEHTVRGEEFTQKSFYNGPYAFLDLLIAEYRDAYKRNLILNERITKLITPPPEFMFDRRLRDKLLFEDKHFTYIRRYFWAYNTLAVINTGIKAMVSAYADTFTDDFWSGTHPLLWPMAESEGPSAGAGAGTYRECLAVQRRELDKVVSVDLVELLKRNERTRKEVENLREQLFSGSSIKESRRAIDQGDNIRILTMISMVFLPLTFVTSVWGMTEFAIPASDWRFAITMVLVCVPFMLIVLLLQTRLFTVLVRRLYACLVWALSLPRRLLVGSLLHADVQADGRPTAAPPRGRKGRLMFVERARAATGWRLPWLRRGPGTGEDVDLGRV